MQNAIRELKEVLENDLANLVSQKNPIILKRNIVVVIIFLILFGAQSCRKAEVLSESEWNEWLSGR